MKSRRHQRILEIISEYPIETQDELLSRLREEGFGITQATVSRDIKDLRIVKTLDSSGKYRYVCPERGEKTNRSGLSPLISVSVVSVDCAQNLVIIKTPGGMAQAVCAAIDSLNYESVAGTIAGDDTIFAACRSEKLASSFAAELKKLL